MPSPSVLELLVRWEEERAQGRFLSAVDLCHESSVAAEELAPYILALEQLYTFLSTPPIDLGTDESAPPSLEWPEIEGYQILGMLGRGGMGIVYKAWQQGAQRPVALKMLRHYSEADVQYLERFRQEAAILARVTHPHIVQIHEVSKRDQHPFFVMEYIKGGSLAHRIRQIPFEPHDAARFVVKLAGAVQAAHDHHILHRDLKPGNVLLTEAGEPKLSDFGLARRADLNLGLTYEGALLGTPSYMAPEQARGDIHAICEQTDVYALGAILYEMLTGRPPFQGKSRDKILALVVNVEVQLPTRINNKVPPELEAICLKCLEKEIPNRYASAQELADDLQRFLHNEPTQARPLTKAQRLWRKCKPLLTVKTALFTCLAALLLLTPLMFLRSSNKEPEPKPRTDSAQVITAWHDQLNRGQPVTLVKNKGLPDSYFWRTDPERKPLLKRDRPLNFESLQLHLLELLPHVPVQRFRLEAEVAQQNAIQGNMGIYVAHSTRETAKGTEHWFVALRFAEREANAKKELRPRLELVRYRKSDEKGSLGWPYELARSRLPFPNNPQPAGQSKWRKLVLEVDQENIRVLIGGKLAAQTPTKMIPRFMHLLARDDLTKPPDFSKDKPPTLNLQGGLGLYLRQADASFRNVVIQKLPDS